MTGAWYCIECGAVLSTCGRPPDTDGHPCRNPWGLAATAEWREDAHAQA